jgi:hypothetical protein
MDATIVLSRGVRSRAVALEYEGVPMPASPLGPPPPRELAQRFVAAVGSGCFSPGCPRSLVLAKVVSSETESIAPSTRWRAELEVGPTDVDAFGVLVRLAAATLDPAPTPRLRIEERSEAAVRIGKLPRLDYPPARLALDANAPREAQQIHVLMESKSSLAVSDVEEIEATVRAWAGALYGFHRAPNLPDPLPSFGRLERIVRHGDRRVVAIMADVYTAKSTWDALACGLDSLGGVVASVEVIGS